MTERAESALARVAGYASAAVERVRGGVDQEGPADVVLPLDPQPWAFMSDQVFGVRSATDRGFHSVSGAYHVFRPRAGYEQDRTRYEPVTP